MSKKQEIQSFAQIFLLKKQQIAAITYDKTKNQSTVISLSKAGFTTQKLPGIKFLQLMTQTGNIKTGIK